MSRNAREAAPDVTNAPSSNRAFEDQLFLERLLELKLLGQIEVDCKGFWRSTQRYRNLKMKKPRISCFSASRLPRSPGDPGQIPLNHNNYVSCWKNQKMWGNAPREPIHKPHWNPHSSQHILNSRMSLTVDIICIPTSRRRAFCFANSTCRAVVNSSLRA